MRKLLASVLGAIALAGFLDARGHQAAEPIRPGLVIRQVSVKADPDQSYAVYLPSAYDPARLWPVIYGFDPMARGYQPVECFREAAEKYGYVLVGSNVSRNGPVQPSVRAGVLMIQDSAARFSLDGKRIYATGFSGGARVACTVARALKDDISGVIGCGAGFPTDGGPSKATRFAFCGTIGDEDFNWTEMTGLDRTLDSLALPHRLLRFEGGHVWPPRDVAIAAVEWLELEAMRTGRRPKDPAFVARLLEAERARAEAAEAAGSLRDAWGRYSDLARAFAGLADVTSFEARASGLASRQGVKDQLNRERGVEAAEVRQKASTEQLVHELGDSDDPLAALNSLRSLVDRFKDDEKRAKSDADRHHARRMLGHLNITAYYAGQPLYDSRQYAAAIPYLDLQAAAYPESASTQYRVAVARAATGGRKKAVEALEKAALAGFSDAARIDKEPAFDQVRGDAAFKAVIERIRANAKTSSQG